MGPPAPGRKTRAQSFRLGVCGLQLQLRGCQTALRGGGDLVSSAHGFVSMCAVRRPCRRRVRGQRAETATAAGRGELNTGRMSSGVVVPGARMGDSGGAAVCATRPTGSECKWRRYSASQAGVLGVNRWTPDPNSQTLETKCATLQLSSHGSCIGDKCCSVPVHYDCTVSGKLLSAVTFQHLPSPSALGSFALG